MDKDTYPGQPTPHIANPLSSELVLCENVSTINEHHYTGK